MSKSSIWQQNGTTRGKPGSAKHLATRRLGLTPKQAAKAALAQPTFTPPPAPFRRGE